MYYTMRVHVKATRCIKEYLLAYEMRYHTQLAVLMNKLSKAKSIKYGQMTFDPCIHNKNRWQMYRTVLQHYKKCSSVLQYSRSSSWQKGSFFYHDGLLSLYFGKGFSILQLDLNLSISNVEHTQLQTRNIVRVDLTRDEDIWYTNFLLIVH